MLRLAFQGLRGRKGPFVGAFVALAIASAFVMACGTLLQAGLGSKAPVERYSGAPIVVAGDQTEKINVGREAEDSVPLYERARVSTDLVERLAAVPGVHAAIADTSTPAEIHGAGGKIEGPTGHPTLVHPWASAALTPYVLASGHAPAGPEDLVVDAGLARRGALSVGEHVRLASNGPARVMTVAGIARTAAEVEKQGVMFVTNAEATRLAATPGRVDAIGILPARGADNTRLAGRLRDVVHGHGRVHTGPDRGDVEHIESIEAKEAVIAIGSTFGGMALLIAMFVVSSTIALSVMQRDREVALLRAIAATPKQVRRMIMWEAIVVGLVASAAGVFPGAAIAGALGHALSERGIAPEDMQVTVGLVPAIAAVASAALTALLAVTAAGRRAARVAPTRALQDSSAEPRMIGPVRLIGGLLSLVGAFGLLGLITTGSNASAAADAAAGVSLALVLAVTFLGPVIARVFAALAGLVLGRSSSVGGMLAVSNMSTSPRRFASAITPLVLTVALSSTMLFLPTTREHATVEQGGERVTADLVLQSEGAGIPESAVAEVRRIPGVDTAVQTATSNLGPTLSAKQHPLAAAIVDQHGLGRVLDLDVSRGSLARLDDDSVALSQMRADTENVDVGQRIGITLGDGTHRRARIAAVYRRALGFGEIVLPTAMARGHRTSPLAESVLIHAGPHASRATIASRLRGLAARYPGLAVGDRHDLAAAVDRSREANDWLFKILAAIVFAFTAIAVVNTLMMIALSRKRELGMLRLIGATPGQIRAMARWEASLVVGLGLGLGGAISLITLAPTSSILTGSAVPFAPIGLIAVVFGSAAAVGLLGSQLSTRLAMRPRPVEAIGLRD